jgi:hypothetical protein
MTSFSFLLTGILTLLQNVNISYRNISITHRNIDITHRNNDSNFIFIVGVIFAEIYPVFLISIQTTHIYYFLP